MMLPNGDMTSDARSSKVVSAEASNLSSLVDAADIVRSKVKYSNENNNVDPGMCTTPKEIVRGRERVFFI